MVEYALILARSAGTTFQTVGANVAYWAGELTWYALGYALLALMALRIAMWAFRARDF
jgi:hypothetical protein